MDTAKEVIAEFFAFVLGWIIHFTVLIVMFGFGYALSGAVGHGWSSEPYRISAGLLSALAFLWLYEGRKSREQFDALWAAQRRIAGHVEARP